MSKVQGLDGFLAALCVSAHRRGFDDRAGAAAPAAQSQTIRVSPDAQDGLAAAPGRSAEPEPVPRERSGVTSGLRARTIAARRNTLRTKCPDHADRRCPAEPTLPPTVHLSDRLLASGRPVRARSYIPEHATLDLTGPQSGCVTGDMCAAVARMSRDPSTGKCGADARGKTWCAITASGAMRTVCVAIVVPEYASLDDAGTCVALHQGYTQRWSVQVLHR
jgi:hypothetical protein